MKKSLIAVSLLVLLSACQSDDDTSVVDVGGEYLATNTGLYSTAYRVNGEANMARLNVAPSGATLVRTNDTESSTAVDGVYDQERDALVFTDGRVCQKQTSGFQCDLAGQSVQLTMVEQADQSIAIAAFAGQYAVLVGSETIDILVDAQGAFSAQDNGCTIQGNLAQHSAATGAKHRVLSITLQQNTCQPDLVSGAAFSQVMDSDPATLEVYLPLSDLSGDWVKY